MFQFPGLIILAIAATRVYRSLTGFVSGDTLITVEGPRDHLPIPKAMQTPTTQIPLDQMGVTVHTTRMQYPRSQMSKNDSFTSTDREEGQHKARELVLEEDLERGVAS